MAHQNLGFETDDAAVPGFPEDWTPTIVTSAERAAGYSDGSGDPSDLPNERFEGAWSSNESFTFEFTEPIDLGQLGFALYDDIPESHEDMEEGWDSNEDFVFTFPSGGSALFDGYTVLDGTPGPFDMTTGGLGLFLRLETDAGATVGLSDTTAGTTAVLTAANSPPAAPIGFDSAGETVDVYFNGGKGPFQVTFDNTHLDLADVLTEISTQLALSGFGDQLSVSTVAGPKLQFDSDIPGYASSIEILNEPGKTTWQKIGFDAGQVGFGNGGTGTGNIKLLDEVLTDDIVALSATATMQSSGMAVTANGDGSIRLWSPPNKDILIAASGTLQGELGFIPPYDVVYGPTAASSETVEDFEESWPVDGAVYHEDWMTVTADPALFDTANDAFEDFEEEWKSNGSFDFTMGSTTAATFDTGVGGASEDFEDFEEVVLETIVTPDVGADEIVFPGAHGLTSNQEIVFRNEGGQLPGGLIAGYTYIVSVVNATDIQVLPNIGDPAITITDAGVGTHYAAADKSTFWVSEANTLS